MKDKYEDLARKYDLPEYVALDEDFELYHIDHDSQVLKNISRKMAEKIEAYVKFNEELVSPESGITAMHECSILSNADKQEVVDLIKVLMRFHRNFLELDLNYSEEGFADFIKGFYAEWPVLKKKMSLILGKVKQGWTEEVHPEIKHEYFG